MIIYSLSLDPENKKIFVLEERNISLLEGKSDINVLDTFISRGKKKADHWHPPTIKWFDDDGRDLDKYKNPDISYFGSSASLIFSPHASSLVKKSVCGMAELLPVLFENEAWCLLNIYNLIEVVDRPNCQYKIRKNGKIGRLLKLAFLPDKVPLNYLSCPRIRHQFILQNIIRITVKPTLKILSKKIIFLALNL